MIAAQDGKISEKTYRQIAQQSLGIINSSFISQNPERISDPFNAQYFERNQTLEDLQLQQLENSVIAKVGDKVVGIGRILDVEGSPEMVSLSVDPQYRQSGIGGELIRQRLERSKRWPMFTFVNPLAESRPGSLLLSYYFHQYVPYGANIPPFEELPMALQRDLARMNDFWGSYVIIRIDGKKKNEKN